MSQVGVKGNKTRAIGSHLWPTASSVLDGISGLHLHLLSDGQAGAVIAEIALLADGFGHGSVDSIHFHALWSILLGIVCSRLVAVSLIAEHGFLEFGRIRERRCIGNNSRLLFEEIA